MKLNYLKIELFYPLFLAFIYYIFNIFMINNGHFHEDAYILFIYVENLVNSNIITYFPAGNPIEGATDFLWMIFISILVKVGIDVGTAVIFLNSIGVFIISYIIFKEMIKIKSSQFLTVFLIYFLPFVWIIQHFFIASLGGFSVNLYLAFILLTYMSVIKEKYLLATPFLGLILGLFRPDGVILGICFVLIGFYFAYKKNIIKKYLSVISVSAILGILYFIWRYYYFGNLLPLPLYVKNTVEGFPGLGGNFNWLIRNFFLLGLVLFLAFYLKSAKKYFFFALPSIILFIILFIAEQSQNVGMRFQAPMFIVLYITLVFLLVKMINNTNNKLFLNIIIIGTCITLLLPGAKNVNSSKYFINFNYINEFPLILNNHIKKFDKLTMVLTEAGRLAYWNQSNNIAIYDLVGLNSEYPAKNTINKEYIENLNPDILMYHHAGQLNISKFENNNKNVLKIQSNELKNKVEYSDNSNLSKVINASISATKFLQKNYSEYDILLVDYTENQTFSHVYALKKDLNITNLVQESLIKIFQDKKVVSYFEMKSKYDPSPL